MQATSSNVWIFAYPLTESRIPKAAFHLRHSECFSYICVGKYTKVHEDDDQPELSLREIIPRAIFITVLKCEN